MKDTMKDIEKFFEKVEKRITLRMTATEKNLVSEYAKQKKVSENDFIRTALWLYINSITADKIDELKKD